MSDTIIGQFTPLQRQVSDDVMKALVRPPEKKQAMEVMATLTAAFLSDQPPDVYESWLRHLRTIIEDAASEQTVVP